MVAVCLVFVGHSVGNVVSLTSSPNLPHNNIQEHMEPAYTGVTTVN